MKSAISILCAIQKKNYSGCARLENILADAKPVYIDPRTSRHWLKYFQKSFYRIRRAWIFTR